MHSVFVVFRWTLLKLVLGDEESCSAFGSSWVQQFLASFAEDLKLLAEVNVGLYTEPYTWSVAVQKECPHNQHLIS